MMPQLNTTARQAEELLGNGEPLLAYDLIQQALKKWPGDCRLRQLRGLALARSGALRRANRELLDLRARGCIDGETLGLLARTHKELGLGASDAEERAKHLKSAYEIYRAGYDESTKLGAVFDGYYTGINAAATALLLGDRDLACQIASDVERLCLQALGGSADSPGADYWTKATLAEAALICGDLESAEQRYAAASLAAGRRYGDISSTRHQARLLLEHLGESPAWLDEVMGLPPVVAFTGHMIDAPGRAAPRFPPELESNVRADIQARLKRLGPIAAYGSAACGADIICLECVQEQGGELHIVLPFPADEFRAMSVDLRPEGQWGERFNRLLESANEVLVVSLRPPPAGETIFEYSNLIMTGLARLRAQMLDTRMVGIAVWDGQPSVDSGGTASVVAMWRNAGIPIEHVPLGAAEHAAPDAAPVIPGHSALSKQDAGSGWAFDYKIETMLFADAVGYSRLTEDQIPRFFECYAGTIADYNETSPAKAVHIETAGDGMYAVFEDPEAAGHYALGLSKRINQVDWLRMGLPEDMNVRIGLHCGPVFVGRDPITGLPLYTGNHTSRTARIEPITPPGQVYASSAFASVTVARGIRSLHFSYIGRTDLAKDYGVLPLYHVK